MPTNLIVLAFCNRILTQTYTKETICAKMSKEVRGIGSWIWATMQIIRDRNVHLKGSYEWWSRMRKYEMLGFRADWVISVGVRS